MKARGRRENESYDLANNGRSRLFTYATGDEVRGWRRRRGGGVAAQLYEGRSLGLCLFSLDHIA